MLFPFLSVVLDYFQIVQFILLSVMFFLKSQQIKI